MSMTMREKIAIALYNSDWDGMRMPSWDDVSDGVKDEYYRETDAVLDALMEPSKSMVFFGMDAMARDGLEPSEAEFRAGFVAAINAARAET